MKWLVLLLVIPFAFADCQELTDGMTITGSVELCSDTHDIPNGITITGSNFIVDCGTAVLRGQNDQSNIGIRVENADNITLQNCNLLTFDQGLYLKNVTHSLIQKNAFLKNRIGVRMVDSYENIIRDNNDKSHQLAVSAITSKFNIVILGNKEIERAFCEVNSCNEFKEMNPCEAGDFYCSAKCSPETDADCVAPATESSVPKENITEKLEQFKQEVKTEVEKTTAPLPVNKERNIHIALKILIYLVAYGVAFAVFKKKRQ